MMIPISTWKLYGGRCPARPGPAKDPFKTYRVIVAGEIGRPGRIVPCDCAANAKMQQASPVKRELKIARLFRGSLSAAKHMNPPVSIPQI